MPDLSARTAARAAIGEGSGFNAIRRDYVLIGEGERERAAQPTPREIVARLHELIAAKSPEHAALVAKFERRQARKESRDA
jgi:SLT domain-containing protein